MSGRWLVLWSVSLVGAWSVVANVHGQAPGKQQTRPVVGEKATFKGWQGQYMMLDVKGQPALVQATPKVKTSYTGTAQADFLAPKMYVKFSCEATPAGEIKGEVKALTICVQSDLDSPFFGPDGDTPVNTKDKNAVMKAFVRGTIRTVDDGEVTIVVPPNVTVKGKVSPMAKIDVQTADVSLAQDGDAVIIDGQELVIPQAPTKTPAPKTPPKSTTTKAGAAPAGPMRYMVADRIEVTSTVPLTRKKPGQK